MPGETVLTLSGSWWVGQGQLRRPEPKEAWFLGQEDHMRPGQITGVHDAGGTTGARLAEDSGGFGKGPGAHPGPAATPSDHCQAIPGPSVRPRNHIPALFSYYFAGSGQLNFLSLLWGHHQGRGLGSHLANSCIGISPPYTQSLRESATTGKVTHL